jgi:hypothetical protein
VVAMLNIDEAKVTHIGPSIMHYGDEPFPPAAEVGRFLLLPC